MFKIKNPKSENFRCKNWRFVSSFSPERARGFTMIELLVVLAIILIMTVVAVTALPGKGTPKQQLRREARGLISLFKAARQTAMERKLKVDVYVDPETRSVYAVESRYGRKLLADGTAFADLEQPESNRFFRVTTFPEDIRIDAFTLSDIEPPGTEEAPLFEPVVQDESASDTDETNQPVFSFTRLGGATGGGVSVARNGLRVDIACDLLTGLPQIVQRRAGQ